MQSQIQCPVCTLFLHVGMNLQVHLDTHPKDQVIKALVNMTVTQQHTNDTDLNAMQCSRYAPLLDETYTSQADAFTNPVINYYNERPAIAAAPAVPPAPPPQRHQQVMIVNSCSTQVYRQGATHQSSSAQQIITKAIPIPACPTQSHNTREHNAANEIITSPKLSMLQTKPAATLSVVRASPYAAPHKQPPPPPYAVTKTLSPPTTTEQNSSIAQTSIYQTTTNSMAAHYDTDFFDIDKDSEPDDSTRTVESANEGFDGQEHIDEVVQEHDDLENAEHYGGSNDCYDIDMVAEQPKDDTNRDYDGLYEIEDGDILMEQEQQPVRPNSVIQINDNHYASDDQHMQLTAVSGAVLAASPLTPSPSSFDTQLKSPQKTDPPIGVPLKIQTLRKSTYGLRILSNVKLAPNHKFENIIDVSSRSRKWSDKIKLTDVFRGYTITPSSSSSSINCDKENITDEVPKEEVLDSVTESTESEVDAEDYVTFNMDKEKKEEELVAEEEAIIEKALDYDADVDILGADFQMDEEEPGVDDDLVKPTKLDKTKGAGVNELKTGCHTMADLEALCLSEHIYDPEDIPLQRNVIMRQQAAVSPTLPAVTSPPPLPTPPPPPPPTTTTSPPAPAPAPSTSPIPSAPSTSHRLLRSSFTKKKSEQESLAVPSTSGAATSVIRLASPQKKVNAHVAAPARPLVKSPFVKTPKKLIVKFKKPFVPVVEEEANLQAPDSCVTLEAGIPNKVEEPDIEAATLNNAGLGCTEDFPFSPFRLSFTPIPAVFANNKDEDEPPAALDEKTEDIATIDTNLMVSIEQTALEPKPEIENVAPIVEPETVVAMVVMDGGISDNVPVENEAIDDEITLEDYLINSKCKVDDGNGMAYVITDLSMEDETHSSAEAPPRLAMKVEKWNEQNAGTDDANQQPCDSKDAIVLATESSIDVYSASASTSSSQPTTSTSVSHTSFVATPGPSRIDYGLSTFLGYNDPADGDDFYTGVRLSPIGFAQENYTWNQRFSPQYVPFEGEKNSYMDLDMCKNTSSYGERAPSTDSLNIRTDEKMPAKGEISEQERNGDIDGSWSHQIYPLQDNLPRYTSSYDTTVARESWSLSNDQNLSQHNMENISMVLPKFTPLESTYQENDIKPLPADLIPKLEKSKHLKIRKYRCPECPQVFAALKDKRVHLVADHNYEQKTCRSKIPCTTTSGSAAGANTAASTSTTNSSSTTIAADGDDAKLGDKVPSLREPASRMNRYLLNYNWNILRQRFASEVKEEDVKLPILPVDANTYMCMVCQERFTSIKAYDAHMSIHPAECYSCNRLFKHWINLNVHLKRHLNIREFACPHCHKKFVQRQSMIEHLNTHSGEAPLQCKVCSKRFRRYSNLIQHRNRHHLKIRPKEKDYICVCGEVFHSEAKIAWHRETHDKKPKCCPYCRERFMHRNSLSRHIRLSHTERFSVFKSETVECPICKKKYMKSSLKAHIASHTSKIQYGCTICNKGFTTKWNLKQHKWIHASRSSKPFKCNVCPKAFIREAEYTSHMNTHKSIKPYTCDHCGCQFARKYNWLRHAREHEKPKGFRCEDCGKVFHRAYYLTEHKRSHTGERPFECIICGKTSTTKTNHNKHVKIHHARDPLTAEG